MMYSKQAKKVIKQYVEQKLGKEKVESTFQKVHAQYLLFLKDLPDQGGKKSCHNGVGGTYDCIVVFALYEVLDPKPTIEELYDINNQVFLPSFQKLSKWINGNWIWVQRFLHCIFLFTAKNDEKIKGGYVMKVEPFDPKVGVKYQFHHCPLATFAKEHGYQNIMPAFCNSDYPAMEAIHATLIRKHTCATGSLCDYWIVGNQSEYAKQFPKRINEEGYFYNE